MENNEKPGPRDAEAINSKITNGEVKLANRRPVKTEKKSVAEQEKTKEAPTGEKPKPDKKEPAKKKPEKSKKPPEKKEPKALEFPVAARINAYGFLNFRKRLLDALGWTKGQKLTIERNDDGSIIVRKA